MPRTCLPGVAPLTRVVRDLPNKCPGTIQKVCAWSWGRRPGAPPVLSTEVEKPACRRRPCRSLPGSSPPDSTSTAGPGEGSTRLEEVWGQLFEGSPEGGWASWVPDSLPPPALAPPLHPGHPAPGASFQGEGGGASSRKFPLKPTPLRNGGQLALGGLPLAGSTLHTHAAHRKINLRSGGSQTTPHATDAFNFSLPKGLTTATDPLPPHTLISSPSSPPHPPAVVLILKC